MQLPIRTKKKQAEADSLALVKLKLGSLGIFREQLDSDFGIDLDLEYVDGEHVTGRTARIQVKSARDLKPRKDGRPTVGGIKQTTLRYWCDISFRTSVIAYAVDLAAGKIYVTKDLFWQASAGIDGGTSSKSIVFLPDTPPDNIAFAKIATIMQVWQPNIAEVVAAHKVALRRLKQFLLLLDDAFSYDFGSPLHEPEDFRDLLQVCSILLWDQADKLWTDPVDRKRWKEHSYWVQKSEKDGWDGISYMAVRPILLALLPALLRALRDLKPRVVAGKFFWAHRDAEYLALVHEAAIPDVDDKDGLISWVADFETHANKMAGTGAFYAACARQPVPPKVKVLKVK